MEICTDKNVILKLHEINHKIIDNFLARSMPQKLPFNLIEIKFCPLIKAEADSLNRPQDAVAAQ
jgi:hypothetical protein